MAQLIVIANGWHASIIENGRSFLNSLQLRLFSTNIAISPTVMPAAVTDEPTGDSGYAGLAPISNPFPNPFVDHAGYADSTGFNPTITFSHSGGDVTIYGAFFTDPASSNATVMAVLADTPFVITAAGQVVVPQCAFRFDTEESVP